jgi:hypothetical protein
MLMYKYYPLSPFLWHDKIPVVQTHAGPGLRIHLHLPHEVFGCLFSLGICGLSVKFLCGPKIL